MNKQITLSIDDFSTGNNGFFWLNKLKEQFPKIKLSMFFVPADIHYGNKFRPDEEAQVKKLIENAVKEKWIELIPHGITHIDREFEHATYADMKLAIKAYEEYFGNWGVPYVKGFKAPQWLISKEAINCLNDNGWFLATDMNQPDSLKAKRNYVYNWDIAFPFPKKLKEVRGHGHLSSEMANHLPNCINNIIKIPGDATWKFISDIV